MNRDHPEGARLPELVCRPPGPRSRAAAEELERYEAPRVNTRGDQPEPAVVWRSAVGSNVVDVDGNTYIDLTAGFGVAAVGHRHSRVVEAVRHQAGELLHGLADVAAHPARIDLARRLAEVAPLPDAQVYFAVSGSDAVEIAFETAWLATGRPRLLAFEPAYHGTTLGSLSLASRSAFRQPFEAHLISDVARLPHGVDIDAIDALLADRSFAAAVVEPIVGREGVKLPPSGWLAELASTCRRHGTLLVADEIFTGFGRTGAMFVCQHEETVPDILCCGKALGGGLPIAAVLARRDLLAAWDRPGEALHTATFLANPLACAAALATLDVLEDERLVERANRMGRQLEGRAAAWRARPGVREVVGRGLLWTIRLDDGATAARIARSSLERGLMLLASGARLQIAPPLVITDRQWSHVLEVLDSLLGGCGDAEPPRG